MDSCGHSHHLPRAARQGCPGSPAHCPPWSLRAMHWRLLTVFSLAGLLYRGFRMEKARYDCRTFDANLMRLHPDCPTLVWNRAWRSPE